MNDSQNDNQNNLEKIQDLQNDSENSSYDSEDNLNDQGEYNNTATFALESLQNMIRQKLDVIEKMQVEVSESRTRLNDMLANSEEYYKADKTTKEALKVKKQIKGTIMASEEARQIQGKLDADKEMLTEQQGSISEMLVEYYETLRVKEIDDSTGEPRDLKVIVKILPKKFTKR